MTAFAESVSQWLIQTSLHTAAIVIVILLLQALAGRRLGANWRCALWAIVLLRLALPGFMQTRFSVMGLISSSETAQTPAPVVTVRFDPPPPTATQSAVDAGTGPSTATIKLPARGVSRVASIPWRSLLVLTWLVGVSILVI